MRYLIIFLLLAAITFGYGSVYRSGGGSSDALIEDLGVSWVRDTRVEQIAGIPVIGKFTASDGKEYLLAIQYNSQTAGTQKLIIWDGTEWSSSQAIKADKDGNDIIVIKQVSTDGAGATQLIAVCKVKSTDNLELLTAATPSGAWTSRGTLVGADKMLSHGASICDLGDGRCFIASYGNITLAQKIWYSTDGFTTWGDNAAAYDDGDPMITGIVGSVDHCHGIKYNSRTDKIYALFGDDEDCRGICWCDPDDLIADPGDIKNKWCLHVTTATRDTVATYGLDNSDYVLRYTDSAVPGIKGATSTWTDEAMRTADIAWDKDLLWGYWIDDSSTGEVMAFNSDTHEVRKVDQLPTSAGSTSPGDGWYGLTTSNGAVLFTTRSVYDAGAQAFTLGDQYNRVYSLNLDGATEIHKFQRADMNLINAGVPSGYAALITTPYSFLECFGRVWYSKASLLGYQSMYADTGTWAGVGQVVVDGILSGTANRTGSYPLSPRKRVADNYLLNSEFADATGWSFYDSNGALTGTFSSTITCPGGTGNSAKLQPSTGASWAYIRRAISTYPTTTFYENKYITLSCWIKFPSATAFAAGQTTQVNLQWMGNAANVNKDLTWYAVETHYDEGWHKVVISAFMPYEAGASSYPEIRIYSYTSDTGVLMEPIYVQDPILIEGTWPEQRI